MTVKQTVLLAGATGVFGRAITRVLSIAGYDVVGVGRGDGNTLRADLCDRDQLLRAVADTRADIVIHAATSLPKPPMRHKDMTATDRLRTLGMRNLVEAAGEIGASRLITESMVFGYGFGRHGRASLTEDHPFGSKQADAGADAHVEALRIKEELTFTSPGLDGISLRYGLFYGPGGTDQIVSMLRKRLIPAPRSSTVLPWVHVADAAEAVIAAVRHGRAGEAYNIVDDEPMAFGQYVQAVAQAFDTPRPPTVPAWLFRPMSMMSAMLRTDMRVSNAKARRELEWQPRHPTAADALRALATRSVSHST